MKPAERSSSDRVRHIRSGDLGTKQGMTKGEFAWALVQWDEATGPGMRRQRDGLHLVAPNLLEPA